jgi:hypothetical protein
MCVVCDLLGRYPESFEAILNSVCGPNLLLDPFHNKLPMAQPTSPSTVLEANYNHPTS